MKPFGNRVSERFKIGPFGHELAGKHLPAELQQTIA
jgi:hypothetical protein